MMPELIQKYFPDISKEQYLQMEMLENLYSEWNSKINVISRKDIDNIYLHHVLHSLAIASFVKDKKINFSPSTKILDVGTGGGFPGIPLAIMFPYIQFTLCDSIGKKVKVAREVASSIKLNNVELICDRVENISDNYDYTVSRAVTELKKFIPLVRNLRLKGMLFLKGGDTQTEITECAHLLKIDEKKFITAPISRYFCEDYFLEKNIIYYNCR